MDQENKNAIERIIEYLIGAQAHFTHSRPGIVNRSASAPLGWEWRPVRLQKSGEDIEVFLADKGNTRMGVLNEQTRQVGAGDHAKLVMPADHKKLFPELITAAYRKLAEIYAMDNEFLARWASHAFNSEHKDLKVLLAAFLLVQERSGQPVKEHGEVQFFDEDYRAVGEAMMLIRGRGRAGLDAKLLLRVGDVLKLPGVAEINRSLGFGTSAKNPPMGRYASAVRKWLSYREHNPALLHGLVRSGQARFARKLARVSRYKPESSEFFNILGWKQTANQHRTLSSEVKVEDSWDGLSEGAICERIVAERVGYKRLTGVLPAGTTPTAAMVMACAESGGIPDRDMLLFTATFEDLGLLNHAPFKALWSAAVKKSEDRRAEKVANNARSESVKEELQAAAEASSAKVMEEAARGLKIFCCVDISASMNDAMPQCIELLENLLLGFPVENLHLSVFNTQGRAVALRGTSRAALTQAFRGFSPGGGTLYAAGLDVLRPAASAVAEDEDALFFFIGDQQGESAAHLTEYLIRHYPVKPRAFGFLEVPGSMGASRQTVRGTAANLGIPCFNLTPEMFPSDDPYAAQRVLRAVIEATPAETSAHGGRSRRKSLTDLILETELLALPHWATAR